MRNLSARRWRHACGFGEWRLYPLLRAVRGRTAGTVHRVPGGTRNARQAMSLAFRWSAPTGDQVRALLEVHHGRRRRPEFPDRLRVVRQGGPRDRRMRSTMADLRVKAYGLAAAVFALDRLTKMDRGEQCFFDGHRAGDSGLFQHRALARIAAWRSASLNDSTNEWRTTLLIVLSAAAVVFVTPCCGARTGWTARPSGG